MCLEKTVICKYVANAWRKPKVLLNFEYVKKLNPKQKDMYNFRLKIQEFVAVCLRNVYDSILRPICFGISVRAEP